MAVSTLNTLEYLRSKTQVDLDALDIEEAKQMALRDPCEDATSNPIDIFTQLGSPANTSLVEQSFSITSELHPLYTSVGVEELAVEVASVILAIQIIPNIKGKVHLMVNPFYAFDTQRMTETAQRYHSLFRHLNPTYDSSRVVIKVPATWEGMQACRMLSTDDKISKIQTLATTAFSIEQCILAAEAGCVSVSPFINDLKQIVYPSGHASDDDNDNNPDLDVCNQAQAYYTHNKLPIRVKACAATSIDQILRLAGVHAHTIDPAHLATMSQQRQDETELRALSVFQEPEEGHRYLLNSGNERNFAQSPLYMDDEALFRVDFAASSGGKAQVKLYRALDVFCDFQKKAERCFCASRA